MLLPLFLAWFSSLFKATIAQLLQLSFWYHLRLRLTFPRETSKEKALREITFACEQGSVTKSSSHTITHGAHLPPPIGFPRLQGWLSSRAILSRPPPYVPTSRHSPTDRISVREGQSKLVPTMRFDTDSFIICVDSFASATMVTRPDQFDDLILHTSQSVQGIQGGLSIKGHGTFKFSICRKPPRYVPYKGTFVPYDGTYGTPDQGQTLDV
jgi:hypothetical protein